MFVARHGRSELTTTILGAGELADLVERMLRTSGRRVDMSTPFVDAMMPDGSRLHVVIPMSTRLADKSPSRALAGLADPPALSPVASLVGQVLPEGQHIRR